MFKYISTRWSNLDSPASLVKALHTVATAKVKDERLWGRLVDRSRVLLVHMDKSQMIAILSSLGKGGFHSKELMREITPLLTKQISQLTASEIAACLNVLRALEHRDLNLVQLLLNQMTVVGESDISAKDASLIMNAAAHFRVHDGNIWRVLCSRILDVSEQLSGQGVALATAALAKVDRRDKPVLQALTAQFLSTEQSMKPAEFAVAVSGFYRLDWPLAWETISDRIKREIPNFDNQAIVSVLHGIFALGKITDPDISDQLIDRIQSSDTPLASPEQRRKFREVLDILGKDISDFRPPVRTGETSLLPKWVRSVLQVLRSDMALQITRADDGEFTFRAGDGNTADRIVCDFQGPFSFYAESRRLTAVAKFRQRLLRHRNFRILSVPYFEWRELRGRDEQLAYLYSKGRATARSIT